MQSDSEARPDRGLVLRHIIVRLGPTQLPFAHDACLFKDVVPFNLDETLQHTTPAYLRLSGVLRVAAVHSLNWNRKATTSRTVPGTPCRTGTIMSVFFMVAAAHNPGMITAVGMDRATDRVVVRAEGVGGGGGADGAEPATWFSGLNAHC